MHKENVPLDKFKELLKNPSPNDLVPVYHKKKGKPKKSMEKKRGQLTLGQRMDRLEVTVNKLTVTVNNLSKTVDKGFKQVNARIDRIEARLDYNNLKKLPNEREN